MYPNIQIPRSVWYRGRFIVPVPAGRNTSVCVHAARQVWNTSPSCLHVTVTSLLLQSNATIMPIAPCRRLSVIDAGMAVVLPYFVRNFDYIYVYIDTEIESIVCSIIIINIPVLYGFLNQILIILFSPRFSNL